MSLISLNGVGYMDCTTPLCFIIYQAFNNQINQICHSIIATTKIKLPEHKIDIIIHKQAFPRTVWKSKT